MAKEIKAPDWFEGEIYDKGEVVTNRWSGESIELNNVELSVYDMIMGATMWLEYHSNPKESNIQKDLDKALKWFKETNPKAYIVLLD